MAVLLMVHITHAHRFILYSIFKLDSETPLTHSKGTINSSSVGKLIAIMFIY